MSSLRKAPNPQTVPSQRPVVLLVDDDAMLHSPLQRYLLKHNVTLLSAYNAQHARKVLQNIQCNLVILDVMLPDQDGRKFAKDPLLLHTPVLMLSALGEPQHRIAGLEAGARDYLSKPFDPKELLLRIRSLLSPPQPPQQQTPTVHRFQRFTLIPHKRLLLKNNVPVPLSNSQYNLLLLLAQTDGYVSREQILQHNPSFSSRDADARIARLRQKLSSHNSKHPSPIQTVRGKGYELHTS